MRVLAVSDIHVDYEENLAWVRSLSSGVYRRDVLLVAGDVSFLHDGSETSVASFAVNVEDGNEDSSAPVNSTFNFTVNPVNEAPVLTGDLAAILTGLEGVGIEHRHRGEPRAPRQHPRTISKISEERHHPGNYQGNRRAN